MCVNKWALTYLKIKLPTNYSFNKLYIYIYIYMVVVSPKKE